MLNFAGVVDLKLSASLKRGVFMDMLPKVSGKVLPSAGTLVGVSEKMKGDVFTFDVDANPDDN